MYIVFCTEQLIPETTEGQFPTSASSRTASWWVGFYFLAWIGLEHVHLNNGTYRINYSSVQVIVQVELEPGKEYTTV